MGEKEVKGEAKDVESEIDEDLELEKSDTDEVVGGFKVEY